MNTQSPQPLAPAPLQPAQFLQDLIRALEGQVTRRQDLARLLHGLLVEHPNPQCLRVWLSYGGGALYLHPPTQTREDAICEGLDVPALMGSSLSPEPRPILLDRLTRRSSIIGAEYQPPDWEWLALLHAQDTAYPLTPHTAASLLLAELAVFHAVSPQPTLNPSPASLPPFQEPPASERTKTGEAPPSIPLADPSLSPLGPMRRALGPLQVGLDLKPKRPPARAPEDNITAQGMEWLDSMSRPPSEGGVSDWMPEDEIKHPEEQWRDLLRACLGGYGTDPDLRQDRTGTGTRGICGAQMRFDLRCGFPAFTSKRLAWGAVVEELAWFLRGSADVTELQAKGVSIWDDNARAALARKFHLQGTLDNPTRSDLALALGPIYGQQWRSWGATYKDGHYWQHDQIAALVHGLLTNPDSRRHIVSAWNVQDLPHMALPPCHVLFQAYSHPHPEGRDKSEPRGLSLVVYQRSCDLFLGVPFNIASYALLLHLLARWTYHTPHELVWFGGDVHLYDTHREGAAEVLRRTPRALPTLDLASCVGPLDPSEVAAMRERRIPQEPRNLFWVNPTLARLVNYSPHPTIKAPMAV